MRRDDALILDILTHARRALGHVAGISSIDFAKDPTRQDAAARCLAVIGEAARRVADETRAAHPEIPWASMAGMRDRLIHGYVDVDFDEVWRTVTMDVPRLIEQLEPLAAEIDRDEDPI